MPRSLNAMLLAVTLAACTPAGDFVDAGPVATDAGPSRLDLAACALAPSGDLILDGVEGDPGYDDELVALDLERLPASISMDALSDFERDLVEYMLEVDSVDIVDRDRALERPLGHAVLGAFARAAAPGDIDFGFLRRGLHRFYACDRGLPVTLEAFKRDVVDFTLDAPDEIVDSRVKGLRRRIWRNVQAEAFIAETLNADDSVRETEVVLTGRRADGDIDLIEYDEQGLLRGASSFAASGGGQATGAVPFACITCHGYRDVSPPSP